jgi:hypothetical protein
LSDFSKGIAKMFAEKRREKIKEKFPINLKSIFAKISSN